MTRLGEFLDEHSANRAEISRKTGISTQRLYELVKNPKTRLSSDELFLIAISIKANPCDLLHHISGHLKLKGETKDNE